jgi:O-antigen biosynthesis protein
MKRKVYADIGGYDEIFGIGNFEDNDFCIRARKAGYQLGIAMDVFAHHFGSSTFIQNKVEYDALLLFNWEIFKRKWGLPEDAPYGSISPAM